MKKRILIADDDENLREINSAIVNRLFPNYETEVFVDGTSLRSRLEQTLEEVELVITDNDMPGINGSEIITQYAKKLNLPFILAYGGDESIGKDALADGAFDYILKPYSIADFKEKIKKAISRD